MKREGDTKGKAMKTYPTPDELYSLELRARRMRQQEIARVLRKGAQAVKAALANAVSHFNAKGVRHA
jgi:transcriptional regulator